MTFSESPLLPLSVFVMIAMGHTQLHAEPKKTCGVWQAGHFAVTDDNGTKWKCKNRRSCVVKETGTCEKIFGCDTTFVEEFSDCTKISSKVGVTKRPEALHQGNERPTTAQ